MAGNPMSGLTQNWDIIGGAVIATVLAVGIIRLIDWYVETSGKRWRDEE